MSKLIVVVDTQVDFMLSGRPLYIKDAECLIAPMVEYLMDNPDADVIATFDTHDPLTYPLSPEATIHKFPPHCYKGTIGWQNVLPVHDHHGYVCDWTKDQFDPWSNHHMASWVELVYTGVPVEIIGVAADYCVKYAYEGFKQRGFDVKVIHDLTLGIKENPFDN